MRLVCLASAVLSSELESRDAVAPLDGGWLPELHSGSGVGATIGRGASWDEDCGSAGFGQNKRTKAIAAQALRLRERPWRKAWARPTARFETAIRNVSTSITI